MTKVIPFAQRYAKWIFLALILISIIIGVIRLTRSSDGTIYTVTRESLINTLQVTGTYAIASQTPVTSPTNGIITKIYVKNDDTVKAGDSLFYVNSTASESQKKAALAAYLSAKSTLDADNAALFSLQSTMFSAWKKYTDLATNSTYENSDSSPKSENRILTEFTTAQDNWLAAEANYKNQQSVISRDQAAVGSALQSYNETQSVTVHAPVAGRVANFLFKEGDQVFASAPPIVDGQSVSTVIPPVLLIADFGNPAITVSISEENIPKVAIGDKADITFDAFPDRKFAGHVVNMDSVGTERQGIVSYSVRIDMENMVPDVKPNMTANIIIETVRKNDILTVPNSAIIEKEGNTYVQKDGSGDKHLVEVTVGLKGLTKSEITKGLTAGDQIILPK